MGRFAEAAEDHRRATELSEPYHEVYTNLGQAYNLAGDAEKAVAAYTNAQPRCRPAGPGAPR